MLALADLKDSTEKEVKQHLATEYKEEDDSYGTERNTEYPEHKIKEWLSDADILIAYESVGSWGCDSSSFFLLRKDSKLYEINGSHCSCYGFENQFNPQETTKEALLQRSFYMGGYDDEEEINKEKIKTYINNIKGDKDNG